MDTVLEDTPVLVEDIDLGLGTAPAGKPFGDTLDVVLKCKEVLNR